MCELNALGGFKVYTEGGRIAPDYPIRVLWCNHSSHLVAFPGPRTHPTSSAALLNSTRARIFPRMCWSLLCQCKIAVVKTIHGAIPQLTRAQNIIFPRCAGPLKRGAPKARGPWHVPLLPYRLIRHWRRRKATSRTLISVVNLTPVMTVITSCRVTNAVPATLCS